MKSKKFAGILILMTILIFSIVFPVIVSAEDTTTEVIVKPSLNITIGDITITGSAKNQITKTITLYAGRDGFSSMTNNTTVTSWFKEIPAGLEGFTAKAKSCASGSATLQIEISAKTKTQEALEEAIGTIEIPLKYINNAWVKGDVHDDIKGADNVRKGASTATSSNSVMIVDENDKALFDIDKTYEVIYTFNSDKGTLSVTGGTFTKDTNGEYIGYVVEGTSLKFTAAPKSGYGVTKWDVTGATAPDKVEWDDTDLTRTITVDKKNITNITVNVIFDVTWTAYRISEVKLGNDYIVKQINENDTDETIITKADGSTKNEDGEDIESVDMKFGSVTPIVLTKDEIEVVTNWKPESAIVPVNEDGYAEVPTVGDKRAGQYCFSASSNKTNIVKAEVVTKSNLEACKTELGKYKAGLTVEIGDLIITPQGEGTATVTLTVKNDTSNTDNPNTLKLSDGKISFDITIEAAATDLVIETTEKEDGTEVATGVITAATKDLYGNPVTLTLDFIKETAVGSVKIEGFSLNGSSWTALAIGTSTPVDISSKIFDKKGSDVRFTEKISSGKPAPGSAVWVIGAIEARPKTPKLKVYYGNPDGEEAEDIDTNTWTVTGFDFDDEESTGLVFASSKDGKNPDKDTATTFDFKPFEPDDPLEVKPFPKEGKVLKSVYFFRVAAILNEENDPDSNGKMLYKLTPASKSVKITVSSETKPVKINVDYKKEKVVLKANMAYQYGNMATPLVMSKSQTKQGIPFRDEETSLLSGTGNANLTYWTAANGKKPRSQAQTVIVYNYSKWSGDSAIKGGFDSTKRVYKLPKGYEARPLDSEGKWVTSIKNVSSTSEYEVRKKGNAKFDATGKPWLKGGTQTASETRKLTIVVDEYKDGKDKNGEDIMKTGITKVTVDLITP